MLLIKKLRQSLLSLLLFYLLSLGFLSVFFFLFFCHLPFAASARVGGRYRFGPAPECSLTSDPVPPAA